MNGETTGGGTPRRSEEELRELAAQLAAFVERAAGEIDTLAGQIAGMPEDQQEAFMRALGTGIDQATDDVNTVLNQMGPPPAGLPEHTPEQLQPGPQQPNGDNQ